MWYLLVAIMQCGFILSPLSTSDESELDVSQILFSTDVPELQ